MIRSAAGASGVLSLAAVAPGDACTIGVFYLAGVALSAAGANDVFAVSPCCSCRSAVVPSTCFPCRC